MTLSVTAAQRSSDAWRASLRGPITRWKRERPARWASEDTIDWAALQAQAQAQEFDEVWAALGAQRGDVIAWNADTSYAAVTIDCSGKWCDDDTHRAPCEQS